MAKSKRSSSRNTKSKPSVALWVIAFLLLAIFIMGLYYLDVFQSVSHNKKAKSAITPHKTVSPNAPQFDFYTILGGQGEQKTLGNQATASAKAVSANAAAQKPAAVTGNAKPKPVATTPVQLPAPPIITKVPAKPVEQKKYLAPVETAKPTTVSKQTIKQETKTVTKLDAAVAQTVVPVSAEKATAYILQIAAVKKSEDADQMKAQLALLGYDVAVNPTTIKETTWYRITLGPYHNLATAQSAQKTLQGYHIKTILHKTK